MKKWRNCKYNPEIKCEDTIICGMCGWNPEVSQKRIQEWKEQKSGKRGKVMTYFDKITASKETLAAFLSSIQVLDGPWDILFQRVFCKSCREADCNKCPYESKRKNPAWFLEHKVMDDGNDPLW